MAKVFPVHTAMLSAYFFLSAPNHLEIAVPVGWALNTNNQGCRFSIFFRYFWPDPFSANPFSIFCIFSYFIFVFLNFLSLFVFIFCETACTHRFSVIFAKVQWHPCNNYQPLNLLLPLRMVFSEWQELEFV